MGNGTTKLRIFIGGLHVGVYLVVSISLLSLCVPSRFPIGQRMPPRFPIGHRMPPRFPIGHRSLYTMFIVVNSSSSIHCLHCRRRLHSSPVFPAFTVSVDNPWIPDFCAASNSTFFYIHLNISRVGIKGDTCTREGGGSGVRSGVRSVYIQCIC